jgi:small-conductance mechanosensitive channel
MDRWLEIKTYGTAILVAGILVAAFVVYRFVRLAISQVHRVAAAEADPVARLQREQRARTLASVLTSLARIVIIGSAVLLALAQVDVNVTPIVAGAGIVGIAAGFGAQSLVKDFFSGFFIVLENQFAIGDQVTVAQLTGTVERMTLRVTVLRDLEGNVHIVPNGKIETVTVLSKEWARAVVDVTIPYREYVGRAIDVASAVCRDFAAERPDAVVEQAELPGVQDLGPRGVTLRFILKTAPGKNNVVARELRRRVKLAFDGAGIAFAHAESAPAVESQ